MGMTIISRTVAVHRGTIEIGDREGGGAKFPLTFRPSPRHWRTPLRSEEKLIRQNRMFAKSPKP
jgi:hypothetical protein